jgi:hypothetical protein
MILRRNRCDAKFNILLSYYLLIFKQFQSDYSKLTPELCSHLFLKIPILKAQNHPYIKLAPTLPDNSNFQFSNTVHNTQNSSLNLSFPPSLTSKPYTVLAH